MMRQDYILRMIGELRQFVAAVLGTGDPARAGEALHAILHAQQRLFHAPPAEFLGLTPDQQLDLLGRAEAPVHAVEKAATYAATLVEAARVYDATHRDALAAGSRQLALTVLLTAAQRWPEQRDQLAADVDQLRTVLPGASLHPPVRELLRTWDDAP